MLFSYFHFVFDCTIDGLPPQRDKLQLFPAKLFMGNFRVPRKVLNSEDDSIFCIPETLPNFCDSSSCARGCHRAEIATDCSAADNVLIVNDAESTDGDDDVSIGAENNIYKTNSSSEDEEDAFQRFTRARVSSAETSKYIWNPNTSPPTKVEKVKVDRQKGDAQSLKRYAYGKCCIL